MDVVISTRRGDLSDRQKAEVREQFERLGRYETRISRVEAHAGVDRADAVHAHGEGGGEAA